LLFHKSTLVDQFSLAFEEDFLVGFIECKKDTYDVLASTIAKPINQSLKRIVDAEELVFIEGRKDDGSYTPLVTIEWGATNAAAACRLANGGKILHSIPVEVFMTGDLAYDLMAQGREGFSTYWCARCQWGWKDWQCLTGAEAAKVGKAWTWEAIKAHCKKLKEEEAAHKTVKPQDRKGIHTNCEPLFDSIPIKNWLMGPLHTVDLFINSAMDIINCYIDNRLENRPQELLEARWHEADKKISERAAIEELNLAEDILTDATNQGGGCKSACPGSGAYL
jgi:hypothetical protein